MENLKKMGETFRHEIPDTIGASQQWHPNLLKMPINSSPPLLTVDLNGQPREVQPGTTVASLLAELGVEPRHVAVELNLDVVPRASHAEQLLAAGDRIEVVTLVGGG